MSTWLVVGAAALGAYLVRVSMVAVFHRRTVPPKLERALPLAGPAVLAAMIGSELFVPGGEVQAPGLPTALAVTAAGVVVSRTGKPMHGLVLGLLVGWVASLLGAG